MDEALFLDELYRQKDKDIRMCTTSVGPHRDDILFEVVRTGATTNTPIDIRMFGSQG